MGKFEEIVSIEDQLVISMDRLGVLRGIARLLMPVTGQWIGRCVMVLAQRRAESVHERMRRDLMVRDEKLGTALAFTKERE